MSAPDFLRVAAVRTLGDPMLTPAEAKVLLALHAAHPDPMTSHEISDAVAPQSRAETSGIVKVWVCYLRGKTATTAVRTVSGGYSLSQAMFARMQDLFAGRAAA